MDKKVEELKEQFKTAKIPAIVYKDLMENFVMTGEQEASSSLSEDLEQAFLKLLQPFLDHHYEDSECDYPMIFRFHDTQLIHGMLQLANHLLTLMYFEKDMEGLITEIPNDDEDKLSFIGLSKLNANQLKFTLWNKTDRKYNDEPIPIEAKDNSNNSVK